MGVHTLLMKILLVLDFLLNVLTGGGFDTCFSTRCYFNSQKVTDPVVRRRWKKMRQIVDRIMFEKHHCMKSYVWGMYRREQWRKAHTL